MREYHSNLSKTFQRHYSFERFQIPTHFTVGGGTLLMGVSVMGRKGVKAGKAYQLRDPSMSLYLLFCVKTIGYGLKTSIPGM
jgi:hypothetical protein